MSSNALPERTTPVPPHGDSKPLLYRWRLWLRTRRLRKALGREPSFGDLYADALGTTVADPQFQAAMAAAFHEVTGESWDA